MLPKKIYKLKLNWVTDKLHSIDMKKFKLVKLRVSQNYKAVSQTPWFLNSQLFLKVYSTLEDLIDIFTLGTVSIQGPINKQDSDEIPILIGNTIRTHKKHLYMSWQCIVSQYFQPIKKFKM